jgi:hypothetical protein
LVGHGGKTQQQWWGQHSNNDVGIGFDGHRRIPVRVCLQGDYNVVPKDEENNHQEIVVLQCAWQAGQETFGEEHPELDREVRNIVGGKSKPSRMILERDDLSFPPQCMLYIKECCWWDS